MLGMMCDGDLPPIPSGPHGERKPEIFNLIDASIPPGMEKVVANFESRPPAEEGVRDRILEALSGKAP